MKPESVFLALVIAAAGCLQVPVDSAPSSQSVEIVDVVDGDTVDVILDGEQQTVRLEGIDTPEVHVENDPAEFEGVPDSEEGRACLERWGEKASGYVRNQSSREFNLSYDTENGEPETGSYGRILGVFESGNYSLNRELVLQGYARSYSDNGPYIEEEREAKLAVRGVWNCQSRES